MKRHIAMVMIIILSLGVCVSLAVPEPVLVPRRGQWTLETFFEHPQQITVRLPGRRAPARFWYLIITVTNTSDSTVGFYPRCELMTDTFQIIQANKGVRAQVFEKIKHRHKGRYPFLESLGQGCF